MKTSGVVGRMARPVLDFVLPPRCAMCKLDVSEPQSLCGPCWAKVTFITDPACAACDRPFEYLVDKNALCAACVKERPLPGALRSALVYDDVSRPLLMRFKHGDGTSLAPMMAKWMALRGTDLLKDTDIMVPVPLHWSRLLARRYNQAALLCRELSFIEDASWDPHILKRTRRTASQGHLSKVQRITNVAAAFHVPERQRAQVKEKRILLVDDVMTTGATLGACAKALLGAGARQVNGLVLARTVFRG